MNLEELKNNITVNLMHFDSLFLFAILSLLLLFLYLITKQLNKKSSAGTSDTSRELLQKVFDSSNESIVVLSSSSRVVYFNTLLIKLLDAKPNVSSEEISELIEIKVKQRWLRLSELLDGSFLGFENILHEIKHTQLKIEEDTTIPVKIDIIKNIQINDEWRYIVTIEDQRDKEKYKRCKYYDHVTKLPNQDQAFKDLNLLYAKTHSVKGKIALMVVEIDNFLKLRSMLGYKQSTSIIIKVANYLTTVSESYAFNVYHMYPNNFLLIMSDIEDQEVALNFVDDFQAALKNFYTIQDVRMHLTASVGISIYPDSGNTRNLLDNAYKAMDEAQSEGDGQVHIFMPEQARFVFDELTLYNEMHQALENNEFELYYQPIMDAQTEELVLAEALIRWIHPIHGLIPPDAFIPIMEKTGFIIDVGKYILDEVLKQQKRWEMFKFKQIPIAINVSMVEIKGGNFSTYVAKKLAESKIDPSLIHFEVTEGKAMSSEKSTLSEFNALHKLGVHIALDDFGTGYTSFSYLKQFPANILKIDQSFMEYILVRPEDQKIVQGMIELAHYLEMKVVVEGVENKQIAELLASYGCNYLQGYYFSKPLPSFEFQKLLR